MIYFIIGLLVGAVITTLAYGYLGYITIE